MRSALLLGVSALLIVVVAPAAFADILSLDASRTGDENEVGGDRYLTAPSMANATTVLLNAGHTIATTNLFVTANFTGIRTLYTGAVDVAFTAQEFADIQAFVSGGGGLVIQRDWDGFYPAADPLALAFGVTFNTTGIAAGLVNQTAAHPIWNGPGGSVMSYSQVFSSTVNGATTIGTHQSGGSNALAVTTFGAGRVVFLTDMDAWDDFGESISPTPGSNNAIVWENIFAWTSSAGPAVPEPSSIALFALGVFGLAGLARRRKSRA